VCTTSRSWRTADPHDQTEIMVLMPRAVRRLLPLLLLGLLSCGSSGPPDLGDGLSVLFIGNSLTYTDDIPARVDGLARAARLNRIRVASVAFPDYSLEDHWNSGEALDSIARGGWDAVVLQQGPSSLPASQTNLREWTGRFAERIRQVGARPALYMVWPPAGGNWDGVVAGYTGAAEASDAVLLPAGQAWRAVLAAHPEIALYGPDQFHPTRAGAYLAALVIFGGLADRTTEGLTHQRPIDGLSPQVAATLERAADEANRSYGRP
jgi:hypothetical protein